MPDISGELGGITMSAGMGDYRVLGDSWVSPGLLWSSEPGVVMVIDHKCRIDISGYIAMSGCVISLGLPGEGERYRFRSGWLKIHIWGYKAENQFENIDMSASCIDIITEGY